MRRRCSAPTRCRNNFVGLILNEAEVIKTAKSAIMQGADGGVATLAWAQRAEAVKSSVKYTMVVALEIRIERADLHSSNHALTTEAIPRGLPETSALLQRHVRIAHGQAIRQGQLGCHGERRAWESSGAVEGGALTFGARTRRQAQTKKVACWLQCFEPSLDRACTVKEKRTDRQGTRNVIS